MKDFFISYTSVDRTWAEWIAWVLEEQGYTVVIQAWDFRPGGNFILDMQRAAEDCDRTVMVLSENYLQAQYTQPEWAAAFAQDPTGSERRLLPVRVAECQPTGMLGQRVYVDLVGQGEAAAEQLLLDALKDRNKPERRPTFPGSTPTAMRVVPQKVTFPARLPKPPALHPLPLSSPAPSPSSLPNPPVSPAKTAMTPRERLALSRQITGLTVQEFNDLLLLLDPPAGLIPPPSTSQGDRVYALLTWAQSTTGCGLGAVQDALADILP